MNAWLQADAAPDAEDVQKLAEAQKDQPKLKVDVSTFFPDAEIFGVKLVNGRPTRALFKVTNNEPEPITVLIATGAILSPPESAMSSPSVSSPLTCSLPTTRDRVSVSLASDTCQCQCHTIHGSSSHTSSNTTSTSAGTSTFASTRARTGSITTPPLTFLSPWMV